LKRIDPEIMQELHALHVDSRAFLERLADRLPADRLASYRIYSEAGEWAELLDVLCATLVKNQIAVTPVERGILTGLIARFPQPLEGYPYSAIRGKPSPDST
jgi:hypothetical protein